MSGKYLDIYTHNSNTLCVSLFLKTYGLFNKQIQKVNVLIYLVLIVAHAIIPAVSVLRRLGPSETGANPIKSA